MINTVVRQIAFYSFERKIHTARRNGELTADDISAAWMSVQGESLGPAIEFGAGLRDLLGLYPALHPLALLRLRLCLRRLPGELALCRLPEADAGFVDRYFAMLKAGGTKHHAELLAPFGLDARDPAFWQGGLGVIARLIDELEAMEG
jgi:oligoendopeptidase F